MWIYQAGEGHFSSEFGIILFIFRSYVDHWSSSIDENSSPAKPAIHKQSMYNAITKNYPFNSDHN